MGQARIRVVGAREHNLQDVCVEVPRQAITVFTGLSGSGKTSLVLDTIATEAQRQLSETFSTFVRNRLPSYGRPEVDEIDGLSPVVMIDQRRLGGGSRSTVGTATDIHPILRLLFSRAGDPQIGESNRFSFNDPTGMCLRCAGIGRVVTPRSETFLDLDLSLEDGAILVPGHRSTPGREQYGYRQYADTAAFDTTTPLRTWSPQERAALLHTDAAGRLGRRLPKGYEGLVDRFSRIYISASAETNGRKRKVLQRFTTVNSCPGCRGARLNREALSVTIGGRSIADLTAMEVTDLVPVVAQVEHAASAPVVDQLVSRLEALDGIGLGYLTLDRPTSTLSGGESQRIKLVRHLGSSLTEMLYVFDEPSIGLHPADVARLIRLLRDLRDRGNTLLVVEHSADVIAVADHVIELGPEAGTAGGRIVFDGPVHELEGATTHTGRAMRETSDRTPRRPREPTGSLTVHVDERNNLHDLDVEIPTGVLTVLTGVAGSGKSSLVGALVDQHPAHVIDQAAVTGSRRSNTATYTGIATRIRSMFATANGVDASLFSSNSDGACPQCRGLGVIETDLAFMESFSARCETCEGRRFAPHVLEHTLDGRSIADVLELTVDEALGILDDPDVVPALQALADVGVGYLTLGQPLSALSGGECQRIKLATRLQERQDGALYVLDEPTTGLHPRDVNRLMVALERLVDAGNTLVIVEHDLDVVRRADVVIDLGPGAGHRGGQIVFSGTVDQLLDDATSVTAHHLRLHRGHSAS